MAVRYRLKEMMKAKKYTVPRLSEQSGLPVGSIKSILSGLSKNPRGETLTLLSKALDCQISDLLSDQAITPEIITQNQKSTEDFLYIAALDAVKEIAAERGISLKGKDEFKQKCTDKIFAYALKNAEKGDISDAVDMVYAKWVFENNHKEGD